MARVKNQKEPDPGRTQQRPANIREMLRQFHRDENGVVFTEYMMVFLFISLIGFIAIISTSWYIRGYRNFLIWWLHHPAV